MFTILGLLMGCPDPPVAPFPPAENDVELLPSMPVEDDFQPEAVPTSPMNVLVEEDNEPTGDRVSARHILVSYAGAAKADQLIRRNKSQARKRAEKLRGQVLAGESMDSLARKYSDGPSKTKGGYLGAFGRGAMTPPFETAAFALQPGAISEVVETDFGFHIIQREELVEAHILHIIVAFQGARMSEATRSRDDAKEIADGLLLELQEGRDFSELAAEKSDGAAAKRGGDLGMVQKGQMVPQFDSAAFALQAGEVSKVVESPFGFHIIKRVQ